MENQVEVETSETSEALWMEKFLADFQIFCFVLFDNGIFGTQQQW